MTLASMTGFARVDGAAGPYAWAWEVRSVNAKGLELRLRLPVGWDAIEPELRKRAQAVVVRGTLHANLSVQRTGVAPVVRVNEPVLAAILSTMREVALRIDAAPPTVEGILGLKGVMEVVEDSEGEDERRAAQPIYAPDIVGDRRWRHEADRFQHRSAGGIRRLPPLYRWLSRDQRVHERCDPARIKLTVRETCSEHFAGEPTNFLIDKTGTVIARDLTGEKLREKLKEIL